MNSPNQRHRAVDAAGVGRSAGRTRLAVARATVRVVAAAAARAPSVSVSRVVGRGVGLGELRLGFGCHGGTSGVRLGTYREHRRGRMGGMVG